MKIGFTINMGNGNSIHVDSNEQETWQEALSEVVDFLSRVREPHVEYFTSWLLTVRLKEDEAEG